MTMSMSSSVMASSPVDGSVELSPVLAGTEAGMCPSLVSSLLLESPSPPIRTLAAFHHLMLGGEGPG